ncbi:MAG: hypothetical protein ACI4PG_07875 [Candidatus Ventricola sp.]
MDGALLHVITFTPQTPAAASRALRQVRRQAGRAGAGGHMLLLCDLPDAPGARMPEDDALVRLLQSGVMAMDSRSSGRMLLLVRRRAWDDAQRCYVGASQQPDARQVVAQLLLDGRTDAAFEAATFSPASLRGQYAAVLMMPLSLTCTPDTPARMLRVLGQAGCVCGAVRPRMEYPASAVTRLAAQGFSLSALGLWRALRSARQGCAPTDGPILCTPQVLRAVPPEAPLAADCLFVPRERATLGALLSDWHKRCLRGGREAAVPLLQLALLFAGAWLGAPPLLAALLPELPSIMRPRLLPGVLTRLSLLPLTAGLALDALLCRALAHAPSLRVRVPAALLTARGCALMGLALLAAAVAGVRMLAPLLPLSLLWLGAPLLLPALDAPTLERIPLTDQEKAQLRTLADAAFFDAHGAAPSALGMLAACAGCMLGLLEPDEAARQVQTALDTRTPAPDAAQQAALLVCAQLLRERMGACDAALRDLPARLEQHALAQPLPQEDGRLAAFLCAARRKEASPEALSALADAGAGQPLDALFLPLRPAGAMARHPLTLPLTHPHAFLRRQLLPDAAGELPFEPVGRFLALAAAALSHPFCPLLLRSPITGPYAPLLACAP